MTRRQSAPNSAQSLVSPAALTVPISAPIPSNSPEMSWSVDRNSSDERYVEYGSPIASTMPRIAPSMTALRSTGPSANRSRIARYASQNGWNASSSAAGVPGWVAPRCPRA